MQTKSQTGLISDPIKYFYSEKSIGYKSGFKPLK